MGRGYAFTWTVLGPTGRSGRSRPEGGDVSNPNIGIKIADGTFYPILERESGGRKKLILTTVKDKQTSVQIDLYEGEDETLPSGRYVGSLLIEDVTSSPAGEAEIELLVGLEPDGRLTAQAQDLSSGESQRLNVSLESLSDEGIYDMPDFELDSEFEPWADSVDDGLDDFLTEDEDQGSTDSGYNDDAFDDNAFDTDTYDDDAFSGPDSDTDPEYGREEEPDPAYIDPPRRKPFLLAVFVLFGIAAVVAVAILLYQIFEGPTIPPLEARRGTGTEVASARNGATNVAVDAVAASAPAPASDPGSAADPEPSAESGGVGSRDGPVAAPEAPALIGGVWYWIRRGDTLWGISSSFYRNPWHYGRIAQENSIRNPDLIFAGSKIFIPKPE